MRVWTREGGELTVVAILGEEDGGDGGAGGGSVVSTN